MRFTFWVWCACGDCAPRAVVLKLEGPGTRAWRWWVGVPLGQHEAVHEDGHAHARVHLRVREHLP